MNQHHINPGSDQPPGGLTIKVTKNEYFDLPQGRFRFISELSDAILLFKKDDTNRDLTVSQRELVKLMGEGKARRVRIYDDFQKRPQQLPEEELGPDERDSKKGLRARTIQFFVRKFDAEPDSRISKRCARKVIRNNEDEARRLGLTHKMSATRLLWFVQNRGTPGDRKVRYFLDQRGLASTSRLPKKVQAFLASANGYYWSGRGVDMNDAWTYLANLIEEENAWRAEQGLDPIEGPKAAETLRRRIRRAENHTNWSTKYSKHEADQRFRGASNHLKATRVGELVIIDHTMLDAFTLLDRKTGLPLGRPWLSIAIDVFSRCLLGYVVSAEPPSLYSVTKLMKRINRDKSYLAERWPDIEGGTDSFCHPTAVLMDNGWELIAPSTIDMLRDLGTEVFFAPIANGPYKAIGERLFHTINKGVIHKVHGGIPQNVVDRRRSRHNPQQNAVTTISDLEKLIYMFQLVYENRPHTGINAIPARIWKENLAAHPRRIIDDIGAFNAVVGGTAECTLTPSGIRYRKMQFHSKEVTTRLINELIGGQARRSQNQKTFGKSRVKVKIKYDPGDASQIQVWHHEHRVYVTLPNRDVEFSEGLSFWAAARCFEYAKEKDLAFASDKQRQHAREQLRRAWEAFMPEAPMRTSREARRGLAQQQKELVGTQVHHTTAAPTANGNGKANAVKVDLQHRTRVDRDTVPAGVPKNLAKAKKTRARNKRLRETAERQEKQASMLAPTREVKLHIPTGARQIAPPSTDGWGIAH